ncbi:MAG: hypothetical protein VKJ06_01475 [Vampirovibrionales bacterium]|nr:hypothetical protein [Vampirovibrionales bacterium]
MSVSKNPLLSERKALAAFLDVSDTANMIEALKDKGWLVLQTRNNYREKRKKATPNAQSSTALTLIS